MNHIGKSERLGSLGIGVAPVESQTVGTSETDLSRQAYQILHFAFTVAPILFGLDKFLNVMTNDYVRVADNSSRIVGSRPFVQIELRQFLAA